MTDDGDARPGVPTTETAATGDPETVPDDDPDVATTDADGPPGRDEGLYRVLAAPSGSGWLFVALDGEPVTVTIDDAALAGTTAAETAADDARPDVDTDARLQAGHRVHARLDWTAEPPCVTALEIRDRTRFRFVDGADPLFEAAVACWQAAQAAGEAMGSDLLRSTDGDVVGVVYTFADPRGDRLEEFRRGRRPIDPLLARIEDTDPPYAVYVLAPRTHDCVAIAIALDADGLLARTLRRTYAPER